jgi:hypothetical protein
MAHRRPISACPLSGAIVPISSQQSAKSVKPPCAIPVNLSVSLTKDSLFINTFGRQDKHDEP